jgi:hypothetical protein
VTRSGHPVSYLPLPRRTRRVWAAVRAANRD